jgi:hypothetical protein
MHMLLIRFIHRVTFLSFHVINMLSCSLCSHQMLICCYRPEVGNKRHTLRLGKIKAGIGVTPERVTADVCVQPLVDRSEIIDTSGKVYDIYVIFGFQIYFEPGVFDKHPLLAERLERDCAMVRMC